MALCEESGSGVQTEVNNRRLKGGEMKPSGSLGKAGIREETMANNKGKVLQVTA